MNKINEIKRLGDVVTFNLDNGDKVFMTVPQFDRFVTSEYNAIDTSIIFEGIKHQYTVILSEPEYSDETVEIIGFEILY